MDGDGGRWRRVDEGQRLRVVIARERFSEQHAWSDLGALWPPEVARRVEVEVVGHGLLEERLAGGGPAADVIVPLWSPLSGVAIRAGRFRLVQQFGAGIDNIDLAGAREAGVWVANMPGLNAGPVAEHAVALLLSLARRLPEAAAGFRPGHWGEPAGRSLAGTTACVVGAGAIGTEIARRLVAFDVVVTGVRRRAPQQPMPPFAAVHPADRLHDAVADADAVLIAASHQPGRPPLIDDEVLRACRRGAWLVNVARGALLDTDAALEHLRTGHLGGVGLDVYPIEPYPPDGPLLGHPHLIATAHNAALTGDYFRAAGRRLGEALGRYLRHEPPDHLVDGHP